MRSTVIPIAMTLAIAATSPAQETTSKLRSQKSTKSVVEAGNGVRAGNVRRSVKGSAADGLPNYGQPSGALPTFGVARLVGNDELEITEFITVYELLHVIIEGGPETEEIPDPLTIDYSCTHDLTRVTARYARGPSLGQARLRRLLKTPTPFVMSRDGRPIDPLFLSFFRTNLLVLDVPDHYLSNEIGDKGRVLDEDEAVGEILRAPEDLPLAPSAGPHPGRLNR